MLEMAVVNLGLSPDEFWDLSWYEWGLYCLREKARSEEVKYGIETSWDQTRHLWATLVNLHSSKKVQPSDLIKLTLDKSDLKQIEPGEVVKKFKTKR